MALSLIKFNLKLKHNIMSEGNSFDKRVSLTSKKQAAFKIRYTATYIYKINIL